jgi:hypothetical protein
MVQTAAPQSRFMIEDYGSFQRAFIVFGVITSLVAAAASSYTHTHHRAKAPKPAPATQEARPKSNKHQIKAGRR